MEQIDALRRRYLARLEPLRSAIEAHRGAYAAAGCGDDAALEKIRLNIVNIFATLATAAGGGDRGAYCRACLERFETVPANWRQRLADAQRHGDAATAAVETVKLETAAVLTAIFREEMEAAQ